MVGSQPSRPSQDTLGLMKILHILDHSLPLHSGYAFRTLAILREQQALGWQVFSLTTPKQGAGAALEEDAEGWHFYRTPNDGRLGLLAQMRATTARLDALVGQLGVDLLHAHSPVLNALPALWVGWKRKLPVVYEMRASWEDAAVDHGSTTYGSLRYRLSRWLESFALFRADQVATICEGLSQDILSRGVKADKVTVIPNAVDADTFTFGSAPDPALRRKLGLDGAIVLGFAGSFYGYEGLDLLLEAAARLLLEYPGLQVLLVGGGPQEANLRNQAQALGLAERVVFTGRVPHAEVQRYYDLIDILVYPRKSIRLTELVTPLKPLEAMAQGRVFVASDVGGHRELIRPGETGFLFPAGDAVALAREIGRVLQQRGEWDALRLRARHFVEAERTWKSSVGRYLEVYRRALQAHGRANVL